MSEEQVFRFMLFVDRDEELRRKYQDIMNNYDRRELTKEEREKITLGEVIPLAKSMGYDFSPENFREFLGSINKKLTDEELDEVAGGRGQIERAFWWSPSTDLVKISSCEYAPDDDTFAAFYKSRSNDNNCPNYVFSGHGSGYFKCCAGCTRLQLDIKYVDR